MKRYNRKRKLTKEEVTFIMRVAQMPCIVTGQSDIQIHHITECGRRLGNYYILPLSVETHRHISRIPFAEQIELCKKVYEKLGLKFIEPPSKVVRRKI